MYLGPDDGTGAWIADLRARGHIPKHWLLEVAFCHPVAPGRARRTVAVRMGARHSRDPVPASLVTGFQNELRDWLYQSAGRRQQCAYFSEFLMGPANDPSEYALYGLIEEGRDPEEAEEAFASLVDAIAERLSDFPLNKLESVAYTPEDISLGLYLDVCKLDFDRVTFGSRSQDQAEPLR